GQPGNRDACAMGSRGADLQTGPAPGSIYSLKEVRAARSCGGRWYSIAPRVPRGRGRPAQAGPRTAARMRRPRGVAGAARWRKQGKTGPMAGRFVELMRVELIGRPTE